MKRFPPSTCLARASSFPIVGWQFLISFPEDHTTANISERLMDLCLEFGLYPKSFDGRTAHCPDAVRLDKLLYFRLEPQLDKPMLTCDCGSDVLVGAEKDELWDWNHCACHCLNIAVQAALKEPMIEGYLAPLTALARRFCKSRSAWNRFKKTQLKILQRAEELRDDDSDADYDGDEDFDIGGEGQPRLKQVLRLLRPVPTRWKSMYYTSKRALALKDSLVMFSNLEWACNGKSPPPSSPIASKGKVLFWSHPPTRSLAHPSNVGKLCPRRRPQNAQNQLGILAELWRFGRMHGAREEAQLIVGIFHKTHNTEYVGLFLEASLWKAGDVTKKTCFSLCHVQYFCGHV